MSAKRALVVDDEANMTRVLKLQLERAGYEVTVATDGLEALGAILTAAPDVLITDISMPRMSGVELCAEIERRLPGRAFPIFVMTSVTDGEHRRAIEAMPGTQFLEKPFSARQVIARMDRLLAKARHGGAGDG